MPDRLVTCLSPQRTASGKFAPLVALAVLVIGFVQLARGEAAAEPTGQPLGRGLPDVKRRPTTVWCNVILVWSPRGSSGGGPLQARSRSRRRGRDGSSGKRWTL